MKILWLCNIPLPKISEALSKPIFNIGGWLSGFAESLVNEEDINLNVCFPLDDEDSLLTGKIDNINYFGFPIRKTRGHQPDLESTFKGIINIVKPDIIHVFGTENSFSLSMIKAFNNPDKTVINIQGLVSLISKHYYSGLPFKIIQRYTIRDLIKRQNILTAKKSFEKSGKYEIEAIQNVNNVIGRTDFDKASTIQLNPKIKYYHCNESLRGEFYKHEWDIKSCERNSIFISQAMYPLKGLHFVIEALPLIIKRFPKTHLYIAGPTIRIGKNSFKDRLLMTSYAKYVSDMIIKNNLNEYITFTGSLGEIDMCNRFLKSHVFVSPSSLENESNSLSEAKLLGVPSVASFVGGVTNRIRHKYDGYLYQHDAPYMLAYYICEIFADDKVASKISNNARIEANKTHDSENNKLRLLEIYKDIIG